MRTNINRFLAVLSVFFLLTVSTVASAFAAGAATPSDGSLLDYARPAFDAIMAGHYLAAVALALVMSMAAFKRYAPGKAGTFARSDVGGVITTFGMSFFGAAATSLAAFKGWGGMTFGMLEMAGGIGFLAIGGYVGVKKLIIPILKRYQSKFPAWSAPAFVLIYFLFDKPDPIKQAEAAGDKAVEASPAKGAEAVTGKPETF